jgi:hypothetical protein
MRSEAAAQMLNCRQAAADPKQPLSLTQKSLDIAACHQWYLSRFLPIQRENQ